MKYPTTMKSKPEILEVVVVLRECKSCGVLKPLSHFTKYGMSVLHVCAACRATP